MIKKGFRVKEETANISQAKALSQKTGISSAFARLLCMRGIDDEIKYKEFISGEGAICDPFSLPDMEIAANRVLDAVNKGERILIYGDYDADGVTSVALLYLYLKGIGGDVLYYIPSRLTEGYGMNCAAIDEAGKNGVKLIVTVDTGITAVAEVEHARSLGIDVVVTDHHECQEELPAALALVDPKRYGDPNKFCEYAGVGVAMKLASAVEGLRIEDRELASIEIADRFSDVVAVGTVADIMSLTGENRFLVRRGIEKINSGSCLAGIKALLDAAQKKSRGTVNAKSIGFIIAPRINAAGRMGSADVALRLLLCSDPYECEALAAQLCELNLQRQSEEMKITEMIVKGENLKGFEKDRVIVLGSEGWHHGVIGIVCSKVVEYYKKPVILLSYEDDIAKGSCRSVEGFNIVKAIESCSEYVERFGGHDLAAGVTLKRDRVDEFRRAINEYAAALPETDTDDVGMAQMLLSPSDMTLPFALELKGLEPYGKDNPEPLFLLEGCQVISVVPLSMGKHTKVILKKEGICFEGLMFSKSSLRIGIESGDCVSVLFTLEVNEYMNKRSLSMNIKEFCFEGEYGRWLMKDSDREYARFKKGIGEGFLTVKAPKREDFVRLYTALKQTVGPDGEDLSYRRLSSSVYGATYFEIRTMLDVFSEAGLLSLSLEDDYGARVALKSVRQKADIQATPTFIRLKELSEK